MRPGYRGPRSSLPRPYVRSMAHFEFFHTVAQSRHLFVGAPSSPCFFKMRTLRWCRSRSSRAASRRRTLSNRLSTRARSNLGPIANNNYLGPIHHAIEQRDGLGAPGKGKTLCNAAPTEIKSCKIANENRCAVRCVSYLNMILSCVSNIQLRTDRCYSCRTRH